MCSQWTAALRAVRNGVESHRAMPEPEPVLTTMLVLLSEPVPLVDGRALMRRCGHHAGMARHSLGTLCDMRQLLLDLLPRCCHGLAARSR